MADRYHRVKWGAGEARDRTKTWGQPVRWNKLAAASGQPWRVFCASLADVFDNEVPNEWRDDLYELIGRTPALTWMLLTKRIGNVPDRVRWPKNVWLGITVVNQAEADRDIPKLLRIDARTRWLSMEPLLEPVTLKEPDRLDWVIVGGESGSGARPFVLGWAKDIVRQCRAAGVPVHVKQLGTNPTNREGVPHSTIDRAGRDMNEWPEILRVREFPR